MPPSPQPPRDPALQAPAPSPIPPPVPPPAAPAASPPAPASTEVSPAWNSALRKWLTDNKTYPDAARRNGEEGRVALRFTVDRTGRVLQVQVAGSSGSATLDEAARNMLTGARLPPFPPGMAQAQQTVTAGIQYTLQR